MSMQLLRRRVGVGLLAVTLGAVAPSTARASDIILPGFDLLDPMAGTEIFLPFLPGLVPFVGDPLGTFDFGLGPVATGRTDTIIERTETFIGPGTSMIDIVVRAMQMVTRDRIDLGAGLDYYYLTLQTGTPSTGTMVIFDPGVSHGPPPPPHGTARYDPINWFFDVRVGSPAGPIVMSDSKILTSTDTPWSHFPPSGAVLIPGVNFLLDGTPFSDFFFIERFSLTNSDGTDIITQTAVPEPATMLLMGAGIAVLTVRVRRRQRQT